MNLSLSPSRMTARPATSPRPPPIFMPQSSSASNPPPTSTQLPPSSQHWQPTKSKDDSPETQKSTFPLPKLRLEVRDLNHAGADIFLSSVIASKALATTVQNVLKHLYVSPHELTTTVPATRSVTLVLRSMPGVAYTIGSDLDSDHKEIHISMDYIHNHVDSSRWTDEIMGVLTHEMVHCYQYNGFGSCPGGLIEGIADWVRLNSKLSPPHWKKEVGDRWDAGYQHTGYFLGYLEGRFGKGTVRRVNEKLRITRYEEKRFWTELCGGPIKQLWSDYQKVVEEENKRREEEELVVVEKEDATTPKKGEFEPEKAKIALARPKEADPNRDTPAGVV